VRKRRGEEDILHHVLLYEDLNEASLAEDAGHHCQ
jgi:hypothetical protein